MSVEDHPASLFPFDEFRSTSEVSTFRILTHLFAFVLPLAVIAEVFQSNAVVFRAGFFSIVITIVASIVIWKRALDCVPEKWNLSLSVPNRGSVIPTRELIAYVVICAALIQAFKMATGSVGRDVLGHGRRFVLGQISLKDAFTRLEPRFIKASVGVQRTITVADMAEYQRRMGAGERILRLTYDGGYANALPGAGIVSEPTYAVVDDPARLLAAKPEEVAIYLRERRFAHFIFNVKAPLFTTVVFTSLFDPREISKFLKVSFSDGDIFILTWGDRGEGDEIPISLLESLDFKRASILQQPFTPKFAKRITGDSDRLITDHLTFDKAKRSVTTALQGELTVFSSSLSTPAARDTLRHMWRRVLDDPDNLAIDRVLETRCWSADCRADKGRRDVAQFLPEKEVKNRLLKGFLDGLRKEYQQAFGEELGSFFEYYDESEPFGPRRE